MKEVDSIARVDVLAAGPPPLPRPRRGTGMLVADRLVLTALHVVVDVDKGEDPSKRSGGPIELTFSNQKIVHADVVPEMWSRNEDWVLLRCEEDPGVAPLPIGELEPSDEGCAWWTYGFPEMNPDGMRMTGKVVAVGDSYKGAPAINLFSEHLAAGKGARAKGISGSPCLVDGAVVGMIRSGLLDDDRIEGGTAYACPMGPILDRTGGLLPLPDPCRGLPGLVRRDLPPAPYRGLKHYTADEAEIFFGRRRDIRALYDMLTEDGRSPIVLLHGQSGVGKSSLLDAGLKARLEPRRRVRYSRRDAGKGLKACFDEATAGDWLALEAQEKRAVVVILDQVEEVFTLSRGEHEAELDELLDALALVFGRDAQRPDGRLLLSFRKEWFSNIKRRLETRGLPFADHFLDRLDAQGIEEVVHGLTSTKRLRDHYKTTVTPDLGSLIAHDLQEADRESPVAPKLQLVMTRLWSQAKKANPTQPALTEKGYAKLKKKGIHLADFVQVAIEELRKQGFDDAVTKGLVEDLLLAHTNESQYATPAAATCKIVDLEGWYPQLAKGGHLTKLLDALARAYLLTVPEKGETRLAHDTLAQVVVTRWRMSQAPGPRARRLLEAWAGEWTDETRKGRTLDAVELGQVDAGLEWMRALDPPEERMLNASREAVRQREQEDERGKRARRRLERLTLFLAAGFALAGVYAWWSGRSAEEAGQKALTRGLLGTASFLAQGGTNLQTAALLAAEALRREWTPEADATARSILAQMFVPVRVIQPYGHVDSMIVSRKGDMVVTVQEKYQKGASLPDGTLVVNAIPDGRELDRFALGQVNGASSVNISDDGERIAVKTQSTLWLRDWRSHNPVQVAAIETDGLKRVIFSKNNHWMAANASDGVVIYKLPEATRLRTLPLRVRNLDAEAKFSLLDEALLVVREEQGSVSLVDVATGELKESIPASIPEHSSKEGHDEWKTDDRFIYPITLSPDGNLLWVTSGDANQSAWHIGSGKFRRFEMPKESSHPEAFSANGRYMVGNVGEGRIVLHEISADSAVRSVNTVNLGNQLKRSISISRNGTFLIGESTGKTVRLWDLQDGAAFGQIGYDWRSHVTVADSFFLTAGEDAPLVTWMLPGEPGDRLYRRFEQRIGRPHVSGTGSVFVFDGGDDAVSIWTPGRQPEVRKLRTAAGGQVEISDNEQTVVIANERRATIFRLPEDEPRLTLEVPLGVAQRARTGNVVERWVIVPSEEVGTNLFGDSEFKEKVTWMDLTHIQIKPVRVRRDDVRHVEGPVHVSTVSMQASDVSRDITLESRKIDAVAVSPGGDRVAISSGDFVWIYDVLTRKRIARLSLGYALENSTSDCASREVPTHVDAMLFSENGRGLGILTNRQVLWSWTDGSVEPTPVIRAWANLARRGRSHFFFDQGQRISVFHWDGDDVRTIYIGNGILRAISRDESYVAVDSDPGLVIWDVASGKSIATLPYSNRNIEYVAFSPDERFVAVLAQDNGVRVWEVKTQQEFARIPAHERDLTSIGFLGPDTLFAASSDSRTLLLHPLGRDKLIAEICRRAVRNLREDEWARYLGGGSPGSMCPDLPSVKGASQAQ